MMAATRAELVKYFTTRMWWGIAIAVVAVSGAMAALFGFLVAGVEVSPGLRMPDLGDPGMVRTTYTAGASMAYLLTLTVGVLVIGAEYRHKTITATLLAVPSRARMIGAKVLALLVIGGFYGLISILGSVGVGAAIVASKGFSPFPDTSIWHALALLMLALGLWALFGLGLGVLIQNQIAAVLVAVGTAWLVEPLLSLVLTLNDWGKGIAQYLPGAATSSMVQQISNNPAGEVLPRLSWQGGALVMLAYATVFTVLGGVIVNRRDIS